jgi:hypothetical protein
VRAKEEGEHRPFAFLTTEANDLVRPVHQRAYDDDPYGLILLGVSDIRQYIAKGFVIIAVVTRDRNRLKAGTTMQGRQKQD